MSRFWRGVNWKNCRQWPANPTHCGGPFSFSHIFLCRSQRTMEVIWRKSRSVIHWRDSQVSAAILRGAGLR